MTFLGDDGTLDAEETRRLRSWSTKTVIETVELEEQAAGVELKP